MPRYEYKVVPAPSRGLKGKGIKGAEARFSHALQELMNGLAGYGWEYQRAETLPSLERSGFASTTTEWRNVLIFRRPRKSDTEDLGPELLPPPEDVEMEEEFTPEQEAAPEEAEPPAIDEDDPEADPSLQDETEAEDTTDGQAYSPLRTFLETRKASEKKK